MPNPYRKGVSDIQASLVDLYSCYNVRMYMCLWGPLFNSYKCYFV